MNRSRRQFLRTATGASLALGVLGSPLRSFGTSLAAPRAAAGNPLRIPPAFSGETIAAVQNAGTIWPGTTTMLHTYGGTSPGPTFRVRSGERFAVRLLNQLSDHGGGHGDATNIHWHGLVIPPEMDGHPKDAIMPGESFDYEFTVEQRAATCWYHPHPHGATARQVYLGMAGLFIIEDDEEQALMLPRGDHDVPLVIQDRRPSPTGELIYDHDHVEKDDHIDGMLGESIIVNGTPDPYLEVESGLYRFRVLNGSNARIYDLAFADNRTFHIIATDGGLLDKPYPVTYAYLAPGERIEILVEFTDAEVGSSVELKSLRWSGTSDPRKQGSELSIIRFDVKRTGDQKLPIPTALVSMQLPEPSQAVRERTFLLKLDHSSTPALHTINDKSFDMERVDEQVTIGDLEIWTFRNTSTLPHPMHVHGAQFRVLDRNGSTKLAPTDFGWKDVVFLRSFETVRVLVRFGRWPGLLLVHCHNLEHEDSGMMLNFEMVEPGLGVDAGGEGVIRKMDLR